MNDILTPEQNTENDIGPCEASLLDVIGRAARDPSVDIDKIERLIAMQERIQEREAKTTFTEAKLAMRPELPVITMRGRIIIRDKNNHENIIQETPFARFEDIQEAIEPILTRHGFDLSFQNGLSPEGKVRVTTVLTHFGGHSEDTYFDLPHDSSGSKNAVQAVGSSTSYAKRYGVISILNIRVAGEDDDANTAIPPVEISVKQFEQLKRLIRDTQSDEGKFVSYLSSRGYIRADGDLSDLSCEHFDEARGALVLKAAKSDGDVK